MSYQISRYTQKIKVSYEYNDAMKYLYHNGDVSLDSDQQKFLSNCSKTTICSHLRFIHGLTWFANPLLLKAILYALSDAKMIIQYLKEVKYNELEPNWSDDWWTCVFHKRDVYSPNDTQDPFWRSPWCVD